MAIAHRKLLPKHRRFVQEYLKDLNASQAAIRAGYSKRTARAQGSRLLTDADISAAVAAAIDERSERTEVTVDQVVKELARIGFANMLDYMRVTDGGLPYVDLTKLTREQAAAIQEFTTDEYAEGRDTDAVAVKKTKFKLHSRCTALELLGRHLGMFKDQLKLEGELPGLIHIDWKQAPPDASTKRGS